MDQQCPVCTLYLHNGMSLESHLETHPKDKVIKALCNLATKKGNYPSRQTTPMQLDQSYMNRSRTPASDDKWYEPRRSSDYDSYWKRTPSRTHKSTSFKNISKKHTPDVELDVKMADTISIKSNSLSGESSVSSYVIKTDEVQTSYQNSPESDSKQAGGSYQNSQDVKEIKFSNSVEYNPTKSGNGGLSYNVPVTGTGIRFLNHNSLLSNIPEKKIVKLAPKPNNVFIKNDGTPMHFLPGKPLRLIVPGNQTFVQRNMQNNLILPANMPQSPISIDTKSMPTQLAANKFNLTPNTTYTPGMSTVVTQSPQIIYRDMLRNVEGKPFISNVSVGITGNSDNLTNSIQSGSTYQNVMVMDQYDACTYTNLEEVVPKPDTSALYAEPGSLVPGVNKLNSPVPVGNDAKTLIIEVGPMAGSEQIVSCSVQEDSKEFTPKTNIKLDEFDVMKKEQKCEIPVSTKGLIILSNIKVEVPAQHTKNLVNNILDLTSFNESESMKKEENAELPEKIICVCQDFEDKKENLCCINIQPSTSGNDSVASNAFSLTKNVVDSTLQSDLNKEPLDSKLDTDHRDMPDLTCNEKPSISPCSELLEHGDNSIDCTIVCPKVELGNDQSCERIETVEQKVKLPTKRNKLNSSRLKNVYVRKNKKKLKIKNAKVASSKNLSELEPIPSSSRKSPEKIVTNKAPQAETKTQQEGECSKLQTISIEEIKESDNFVVNFEKIHCSVNPEEQIMEIELGSQTKSQTDMLTTAIDIVQVKEENSASNEGVVALKTFTSEHVLTTLETLRPISATCYDTASPAVFDDASNHRELLDLESASKTKHFASMMNDNYFGDNMYSDYFAPDRVDFGNERDTTTQKDGMYNLWGETSQKDNAFILPNFIHESYKIAESTDVDFTQVDEERQIDVEGDGCEKDSKVEVLSESRSECEALMDICANEQMPPRGELSGQESNGDMESSWNRMYPEVTTTEAYDLLARESWVSDGSDMDATEKIEPLDEDIDYPKSRTHTCVQCNMKFSSAKELRLHKTITHAPPTSSITKTTYSRMVTARTIKKEEEVKTDDLLACNIMAIDTKESLTTTLLQAYHIEEMKIDSLTKQETKKRKKNYICPTCKVDQVTDARFTVHLKIHPLECLTCGKLFYRRANLALHIKSHLGIKNYKCDVCEKRFLTRQKLSEHSNIHTGRAPIKCTLCDDTFRRYSNMVQHRNRHHLQKPVKVRDFVCHCGDVFHSKAKLRWHQETHDEKPKSCPHCSDKFLHAASLTRHIRRTHNQCYLTERLEGKVDNVPCPICKQIYLRPNLRAHLQTHTGKRPFVCVICNKGFTTKWNLKLHRWTHMSRSAKPFKCHLCKGAFIRQTEYTSHMNAHKSVRPYTCNYCGCQFIRRYNCQRHVKEHEMAKKFPCKVPECGKSFHRSYYLAEHMRVHSGVRPFACNICGKTSSNKSNHNKHIKIHHAREPVATEA